MKGTLRFFSVLAFVFVTLFAVDRMSRVPMPERRIASLVPIDNLQQTWLAPLNIRHEIINSFRAALYGHGRIEKKMEEYHKFLRGMRIFGKPTRNTFRFNPQGLEVQVLFRTPEGKTDRCTLASATPGTTAKQKATPMAFRWDHDKHMVAYTGEPQDWVVAGSCPTLKKDMLRFPTGYMDKFQIFPVSETLYEARGEIAGTILVILQLAPVDIQQTLIAEDGRLLTQHNKKPLSL